MPASKAVRSTSTSALSFSTRAMAGPTFPQPNVPSASLVVRMPVRPSVVHGIAGRLVVSVVMTVLISVDAPGRESGAIASGEHQAPAAGGRAARTGAYGVG